MACRNPALGIAAANALIAIGFDCEYRNCDISSTASINAFVADLQATYVHIDILVNNAAMAFKISDNVPFEQQAEPTLNVNFFGTVNISIAMLPLLRASRSPRVVNVASTAGALKSMSSPTRRGLFYNYHLTLPNLEEMVREYIAVSKLGSQVVVSRGWPLTCFGMSKLALIAFTRILAREEPTILVTSCCPGWCATDMSCHSGPFTAEQGARTPSYLALLPPETDRRKSGCFFKEGAVIDW